MAIPLIHSRSWLLSRQSTLQVTAYPAARPMSIVRLEDGSVRFELPRDSPIGAVEGDGGIVVEPFEAVEGRSCLLRRESWICHAVHRE